VHHLATDLIKPHQAASVTVRRFFSNNHSRAW